jgi:hypothetical protein
MRERRWWIYRAPRVPGCPRHERAQQPCEVLAEATGPGPHNVALRFEDGHAMITIRRDKSLRPLFAREEQLTLEIPS